MPAPARASPCQPAQEAHAALAAGRGATWRHVGFGTPWRSSATAAIMESIKGLAWAVFEGARNPYYNLIVIYVFAPYFAKELAGGGEHGLSLSGLALTHQVSQRCAGHGCQGACGS